MTDQRDPDDLPNGAGEGDSNTDAPDTTSGGAPQEPDGTPVENPSGG
jgi:hypothetical protein